MLEDSLFESQGRGATRKPITIALAAIAHIVTVTALALIPLLRPQALTLPPINLSLLEPRTSSPAPRVPAVAAATPAAHKYAEPPLNAFTTPTVIPERIAVITEDTTPDIIGLLPTGNGSAFKLPAGLLPTKIDSFATPAPPVLPPPPVPTIKVDPIRLSSGVQAANMVHQVNPEYPMIARQAHVQGVVVMEAVISKEGAVENLRVISGHQLLNQAALDAVKQWTYRPTMLNGNPVEVLTTITVRFTLK